MAEEATSPPVDAHELTVDTHSNKPTLSVKVYAPFKVYFEGDAYSVSALNANGPFDILPRHRNFLCMLMPCTLTLQTPSGQKDIQISRALMHVKGERVAVFIDV